MTSTGGTVTRKATWATTTLLEPGRHLLLANSTGVFAASADAVYSGGFAATGGALVSGRSAARPSTPSAGATRPTRSSRGRPRPRPGRGARSSAGPAASGGNVSDTNDNAADFVVNGAPVAQNLAAAPVPAPAPSPRTRRPTPTRHGRADADGYAHSHPDPGADTPTAAPTLCSRRPRPRTRRRPRRRVVPTATPTTSPSPSPAPSGPALAVADARHAAIGSSIVVRGVVVAEAGRLGTPAVLVIADATGGLPVRLPDGVARPRAAPSSRSAACSPTRTVSSRSGREGRRGPGRHREPPVADGRRRRRDRGSDRRPPRPRRRHDRHVGVALVQRRPRVHDHRRGRRHASDPRRRLGRPRPVDPAQGRRGDVHGRGRAARHAQGRARRLPPLAPRPRRRHGHGPAVDRRRQPTASPKGGPTPKPSGGPSKPGTISVRAALLRDGQRVTVEGVLDDRHGPARRQRAPHDRRGRHGGDRGLSGRAGRRDAPRSAGARHRDRGQAWGAPRLRAEEFASSGRDNRPSHAVRTAPTAAVEWRLVRVEGTIARRPPQRRPLERRAAAGRRRQSRSAGSPAAASRPRRSSRAGARRSSGS